MIYGLLLQDAPPAQSLLTVFSHAGGFQWPLLGILLAGLLVLAVRFAHSAFDRRAARSLQGMALGKATPEDFARVLNVCDDSLYARILAGILELWHAGAPVAAIGQEARGLVSAAHAAYARTERIVGFLSSAAGGLGLLGTLVGIYLLFSAGTRDAEAIFAGIAIAIGSTLLGIVVTIVLEFLEALLHAWASRHVEAANEWGAQVRYRLLALDAPTEKEDASCAEA